MNNELYRSKLRYRSFHHSQTITGQLYKFGDIIRDTEIEVKWVYKGNSRSTTYNIEDCLVYINDGTWILTPKNREDKLKRILNEI